MRPVFKTIYIEMGYIKKMKNYGKPEGDQLGREIEAALNEQHREGYRLQEMMPISSSGSSGATYVSGYMLFFKLNGTEA